MKPGSQKPVVLVTSHRVKYPASSISHSEMHGCLNVTLRPHGWPSVGHSYSLSTEMQHAGMLPTVLNHSTLVWVDPAILRERIPPEDWVGALVYRKCSSWWETPGGFIQDRIWGGVGSRWHLGGSSWPPPQTVTPCPQPPRLQSLFSPLSARLDACILSEAQISGFGQARTETQMTLLSFLLLLLGYLSQRQTEGCCVLRVR